MTTVLNGVDQAGPGSGTAFALNADIVGYSRLLADDPVGTTARLDDYRRLVDKEVVGANGQLVNFVGDNFMAVFSDASDALKAAIAITTDIEHRNEDLPEGGRMRFRMGIDMGPITITDEGQYVGDALNIAARIQSMALPGGISVSGAVFKALDEPALRFRSIGPRRLKNIPEQVQVYEFADLPTDQHEGPRRRGLGLENPSVAVLPMHTEGLEDEIGRLSRPFMADIVTRLARIPNLNVVDVSSTRGHEDMAAPEVPVRYMLQMGMYEVGDQIRVYSQLIEASSVNIIWAERWDAARDGILALSDQAAADVAHAIEIELVVGEPSRIYNEISDPALVAKVYQGWYELTSGTKEGWRKAVELFGQVAGSQTDEVAAHALLAYAHWVGASQGFADPESELAQAKTHAEEAIAMNDDTGLSRMVLAAVCLDEGLADRALEETEAAVILRPTCDVTLGLEASIRRYVGQWEQAIDLAEQAMGMTPLTKPWYPTVLASSYYVGERYEDAASTAEAVLEHQPHNLEALLVLAASQAAQGLERRAAATAELVRDRFPTTTAAQWLQRSPYQDPELVGRWQRDLAAAGLD